MPPFTLSSSSSTSSSSSPSSPPRGPPEKRRYAPLTPSPLNPNLYVDHPRRQLKTTAPSSRNKRPTRPKSAPSKLQQKYAALAHESPTQRLLRQKAAAAWRSETLRQYVLLAPPQAEPGFGRDTWPLRTRSFPSLSSPSSASFDARKLTTTTTTIIAATGNNEKRKPSHDWLAEMTIPSPRETAYSFYSSSSSSSEDDDDDQDADEESDIALLAADKRPAVQRQGPGLAAHSTATATTAPGEFVVSIACGFPFPMPPGRRGCEESTLSLLPLNRRAGRQHVGVSVSRGSGGEGGGGVTARRILAAVALFLALGLFHGLVSTFGSGGGAVRGRPPAVR